MTTTKRPQLATDLEYVRVAGMFKKGERFCILPKIDGVRGMYMWDMDMFTGRSLLPMGNKYNTAFFSRPCMRGFDGELAAESETHPDLCRLTTSATSSHGGEPWLAYHVFDYITPETEKLSYEERHRWMCSNAMGIQKNSIDVGYHIRTVSYREVRSVDDIKHWHEIYTGQGYEGSIIRSLDRPVKFGRCTPSQGFYLRIKDFIQEDAVVLELQEALQNNNEAVTNELGLTERSSHQDNKTPKGLVGAFICRDVKTGKIITVGAGNADHATRKYMWENPHTIVGKTISYKHFPKGVKDKPRFPTFVCVRDPSDLV